MKNKSILVIDTPKNCHDCPIIDYCHNNDGKCNLLIRQDWCPLSPLPSRKDLTQYMQRGDAKSMTHMMMSIRDTGYNECLDDILKGNIDGINNIRK